MNPITGVKIIIDQGVFFILPKPNRPLEQPEIDLLQQRVSRAILTVHLDGDQGKINLHADIHWELHGNLPCARLSFSQAETGRIQILRYINVDVLKSIKLVTLNDNQTEKQYVFNI